MHAAFQRKIAAETVKRQSKGGRSKAIRYFGQAMKDASDEHKKAVRELVIARKEGRW